MYRNIAEIYCRHNSGSCLRKGIDTIRPIGCQTLPISRFRYAVRKLLTFPSTVRREHAYYDATWISHRDITAQLSETEQGVLSLLCRIFFVPLHQFLTMYDDLIGMRAADLKVKTLGPHKAQNEGHMFDVLADWFFNCVLAARFRRQEECQESGACAIVDRLV